MSAYSQILEHVFNSKAGEDRPFTKDELEKAALLLSLDVKNVADIRYTYDSREDFPFGNWAIVGRGKGKYSFVTLVKPNLIRVPDDIYPHITTASSILDMTPELIRSHVGNDEQATLTRLSYSSALQKILNLAKFEKLQDHYRTFLSAGQIEVDEVCIGEDTAGNKYIVPIAAKGGKDHLSFSQVYHMDLFCREKFPKLIPMICGMYKALDGRIFLVRFDTDGNINNTKVISVHCIDLC